MIDTARLDRATRNVIAAGEIPTEWDSNACYTFTAADLRAPLMMAFLPSITRAVRTEYRRLARA